MGLSREYLKQILYYDLLTGTWIWLVDRGRRYCKGQRAGCIHPKQYRFIRINGKNYKSSRLAWLYMTGEWPSVQIDHEDTNTLNDKWENLRLATHQQNMYNRSKNRRNTSGFKGVWQENGKWRVRIRIEKKKINLGRFLTPEEAHKVYEEAAKVLHKEFARW